MAFRNLTPLLALLVSSLVSASDLRIVYTANRQGEIEPCGCQVNQIGGLNRMAAFLEADQKAGKNLLVLDSGDTFFSMLPLNPSRVDVENLRADAIADAYRSMGVKFLLPGERDFAQGPGRLKSLAEKAGVKLLAANLAIPGQDGFFIRHITLEQSGQRVFLTGIADPNLYPEVGVFGSDPEAALSEMVKEAEKEKATIKIVLSHLGSKTDEVLAAKYPGLLFLGSHSQDIFPRGLKVGQSMVFQPQNEGQQIGVIDFSDSATYSKTELIGLSSEWDLKNSVKKRMQAFYEAQKKLERKKPPTKTIASERPFVANALKCQKCHEAQFNFWAGTKHASAWLVLFAKNQHFDSECIGCHSLGFDSPLGFSSVAHPIEMTSPPKKGEPFVEKLLTKVFEGDVGGPLDSRVDPKRYQKLHDRYWQEIKKSEKQIKRLFIGVQCEHCHGNRAGHPGEGVVTQKKVTLSSCTQCHRPPNAPEFDPKTISKIACPRMGS